MSQAGAQPWARIKSVLAGALERTAADRAAFLDTACGDDTSLRKEVESLLAAYAAAEATEFIETPPELRDPAGLEGGHLVGPYKILEEIGRGGMGAVYKAVRADDQYQKQVALKVVGRLDPDLVRRFRAERQILAGLDHPGIARLIDGGATADGLPWLAMDFVEGRPITEYVQAHALSLPQRLQLFRETCAAVHYAHQNLVVHRDLKPSNILVTPEGAPRLLDFGIAKLLSDEDRGGQTTLTRVRAMTPEYASPEQALGQPITTASDVYSLGVLLCEILTGRLPHEFARREPIEVARVISTEPPVPPSTLAGKGATVIPSRQLQGDLDNIVLMALRKEPERRYASVDQLSEDVRRYLDRRPVIARPDTIRYRVDKFVRRNRALVATAAALSLSLVVALAVAVAQAREARRERAKAEQRFEDVHQLANFFLFEFHNTIADLPGSTPARQLLVSRGLEYLDRLSREGGTPALQRDIANAYGRVGDLQGRPNYPNLGDSKGALASYDKSVAALRALDAANPGDWLVRRDLAAALHRKAVLVQDTYKDAATALALETEALSIVETVAVAAPNDLDALRLLLNVNTKLADIYLATDKPEESLAAYERALPRYEAVFRKTGTNLDQFNLGIAQVKVGAGLRRAGRRAEALAAFEQGRATLQALVKAGHDVKAQRSLSVVLNYIGDLHTETGEYPGAVAAYREALAMREALAPADPRNALARADLVGSYLRIGDALAREKDLEGASREYARALPISVAIEARDKADPNAAADRAGVEARMAEIEARQGRPSAARARYEIVIPRFEAVVRTAPTDRDNKYDVAVALLGRAGSESALAASSGSRDLWEKARASYARSLDLWRTIDGHTAGDSRLEAGPVEPNVKAAQDGLARCDEAVRRLATR